MNTLLKKSIFLLQFSCIASHSRSYAMQAVRNDGAGGRGIQFVPKSGEYKNVVVWLHGLGDTADGWASMMPELRLENTKFILPTAKSRPIALNGGMPMPGKNFQLVGYYRIVIVALVAVHYVLLVPFKITCTWQGGVTSTVFRAVIVRTARGLTNPRHG